uniref:Methylmalonyl-CoA mutase n=2 Tax=Ascaridoidea TaxID=33256 RepID=F1LG73_ASCSU
MGSMDQKDDHHRMIAATGFADLGFDVDVGPIVQTPEQVARQAVDADVHAIGARNLCSKHLTLIPELFKELAKLERPDILVLVADNIPPKDYDELYRQGVTAIFSPRSDIGECAIKILDAIEDAKKKNTVR